VSGLRDLALIAAMFYSFARVSAVLKLKVDDYYHNGARLRPIADGTFPSRSSNVRGRLRPTIE
jgi:hypothetical protein